MAWGRVQAVSAFVASGGTTLTVTFTTQNVGANKYIAEGSVSKGGASPTVASIKDGTNTFTLAGSVGQVDSGQALGFMDIPAGSQGTKPTITMTSAAAAPQDMGLMCQEVSGLVTGNTVAAAVDGTVRTAAFNAVSTGSGEPSPQYVSTAANEYLVSAYGDFGVGNVSQAAAGYTADPNSNLNANASVIISYKNSTNATETSAYTWTSTNNQGSIIVCAFKLAAAGAAPVWVSERRRERTATPPLVRRGAVLFDFKPQFNPIRAADSPQQRRAIRGWLRVRGRYIDPPWPQQTAPANPPIAFSPSQRRAVRGWLRTRGRYAEPPWPQATPPANPAIVFNPSQRRTVRGWIRVRGRYADPPMPQAYGPNPAIVVPPSRPRRLQNLFRSIGRRVNYPWPQAVQPPSQDVVLRVGQTVGRWFAGSTVGRWATGSTVSRWQAGETVSAWKVISQGATMSQTIASASLQYVRTPITATVNGANYNPTVDAVQMAFTSTFREPVLADFNAGSWETAGSTYYARCLVGPGGAVALTAGVWFVWVKITDSPEIPVLPAGTLTVTP